MLPIIVGALVLAFVLYLATCWVCWRKLNEGRKE